MLLKQIYISFRLLNAELEAKTAELVRQAEQLMVRHRHISAHTSVCRVNGNVEVNVKAQTESWNWSFVLSERTKWSSVEAGVQSSALRQWRWKHLQVISIEYETLSCEGDILHVSDFFYDSLLCCKNTSSQHFQIFVVNESNKTKRV